MTRSRWRWLALLPFLATIALVGWNVASVPIRGGPSTDLLGGLVAFLSALAFAAIGSYLAYRLPHNVIGWLMTLYALVFAFSLWSEAAAEEGRLSVGAGQWAAWFGSFSWAVNGITITVLIPLLFPTGKLPSPKWRLVLWTAALSLVLIFVANAFSPEATAPVVNPLGQPAWTDALSTVGLVGFALFLTSIAGTVVAVVGRFRRSRGVERAQMQVFAFGAVAIATGAISTYALYELGFGAIAQLVMATVSLVVPAAIGVAVLKYRLYDLDRIVKRTVTYSASAIVLVSVYGLSVIGLQAVLGADDSLSVAASTLAAAALFNPVRTRVQRLVERRFDRSRYDAAQVVEAFSARISQEVDIDLLQSDLSGLVRRTLRPSDVSLWVRGPST